LVRDSPCWSHLIPALLLEFSSAVWRVFGLGSAFLAAFCAFPLAYVVK
jgi:hypothetical protein